MTAGAKLRVDFDPAVWKPLAPLLNPEPVPDAFQSMTWELEAMKGIQITVASHPEQVTEEENKRLILETQKFRGDPAELVREFQQSIVNRIWMVLEFRNARTRPSLTETHYFLPAGKGHVTFLVIGDEKELPGHRVIIEAFLRNVHIE